MPPWQAFHAGTIEGDAQLKLILNEQVRKELNYSRLARMGKALAFVSDPIPPLRPEAILPSLSDVSLLLSLSFFSR
jgi:hypothetical protein